MASETRDLEKEISALSKEVGRSTETRKELIRMLTSLTRQVEKLNERVTACSDAIKNSRP